MPITTSAKKALRQSKRKKSFNDRRKRLYRDAVKEFKKAVAAKEFDKAKSLLPQVYKRLDKAAKSHTIAKNKASRTKSRLTALMKSPKA
ncbi:MAG: 30S ribosomal protein S20 [Patescibacteria group bacterium]